MLLAYDASVFDKTECNADHSIHNRQGFTIKQYDDLAFSCQQQLKIFLKALFSATLTVS